MQIGVISLLDGLVYGMLLFMLASGLAEAYGKSLAGSVEAVLSNVMQPVSGDLSTQYAELPLALDTLPTRDELETQSKSKDKYIAQRARLLIEQVDGGKPLRRRIRTRFNCGNSVRT